MTLLLLQNDRWWCPMCGAMDGAWGWGMMFFMMLFWIVLIALVVWLVIRLTRSGGDAGGGGDRGRAEQILRERYARGEVDRETFERMLDDLRRTGR